MTEGAARALITHPPQTSPLIAQGVKMVPEGSDPLSEVSDDARGVSFSSAPEFLDEISGAQAELEALDDDEQESGCSTYVDTTRCFIDRL